MPTTSTAETVTLGGRPASHCLRSTRDATLTVVERILASTDCRELTDETGRGEVAQIAALCVELAADVLDSGTQPSSIDLSRLRESAGRWARAGMPIAPILHAFHAGFSAGLRLVADTAGPGEHAALVDGAVLMFGLLDVVSEAVTSSYLDEYKAAASLMGDVGHSLTTALLAGDPRAHRIAERSGIELAASYEVVALHFSVHPDESGSPAERDIAAGMKQRRIHAAIADAVSPSHPLAVLSPSGGTVLVPDTAPNTVEAIVDGMSAAGGVPIHAASVTAVPSRIPEEAENAYELLRLVHRLEYRPGVHRIADLALEFQIARPGVGRRHLQKILDPLRLVPDLLPTLRAFVETEANRKKAAKQLVVHPNTVDYRLKRIEQITGIDPMKSSGLRSLHAALVADSLDAR
ncbi:PucR family transcriptional regulator [Rhodococcoides kyotonense]|uniref:PucR C-terminal helix-turn-helix domain-containing protein n=1 Tax=Rhodococcoides kyotonense TaxID=398843 RepID=A0A239KHY5_9NOCA|nr:PucR family transcriptional regulator [Rhodococcus kyotonensis]SNT17610.1 PucR C-terminal helix-turn-helix domain-containing protein [Rhodococcus kyotonensis]